MGLTHKTMQESNLYQQRSVRDISAYDEDNTTGMELSTYCKPNCLGTVLSGLMRGESRGATGPDSGSSGRHRGIWY